METAVPRIHQALTVETARAPGPAMSGERSCDAPLHQCIRCRRVVVRFEFSGVPAKRAKFRILWLVLERSEVEVCVKDPGYPVDVTCRGKIADFVAVYLGHARWRDMAGKTFFIEGERNLVRSLPAWLTLDKVVGRE